MMLLFGYRVESDDEHSSFALEIIYCIIKSSKLDSITLGLNEKFQSKDITKRCKRFNVKQLLILCTPLSPKNIRYIYSIASF